MNDPSPSASNGRGPNGKFLPGNRAGKGNPHAQKVQQLRGALLAAVKVSDIRDVIRRLVEAAKAGDVAASKLILDRCLGPAEAIDVLGRLEALESMLTPSEPRRE